MLSLFGTGGRGGFTGICWSPGTFRWFYSRSPGSSDSCSPKCVSPWYDWILSVTSWVNRVGSPCRYPSSTASSLATPCHWILSSSRRLPPTPLSSARGWGAVPRTSSAPGISAQIHWYQHRSANLILGCLAYCWTNSPTAHPQFHRPWITDERIVRLQCFWWFLVMSIPHPPIISRLADLTFGCKFLGIWWQWWKDWCICLW